MTKDEKAAYWRQQVDGFQASGLSAKNYCAQEGIAVATLMSWNQSLWIGTLRLIPGIRNLVGVCDNRISTVQCNLMYSISGRNTASVSKL